MQTREFQHYKGYVIEADPQRQADDGAWGTYLVIRRDRPTGPTIRPFEDDQTFRSRLKAIRHCWEFGRAIIDGTVEGCTVEDL